jgi:integrase
MRQITSIKKSPGASALITWTEPLRGFSTSQRATTSPFTASSSASCRSNCRRLPKSIRKSHDGEELMCIECGLDNYPNWGIYKTNTRERVRMFVAVLRWTGMRISDAVQLSRSTIVDGQITLRTQKTGKRVSIPMNPFIAEGLKDIGGEYFFWSGNGKVSSAVSDWERTLARLGKLSHVKCHAHRWRHTFIIECLWRGVPVSEVAAIVGKSPRIIEQHYSQVGAIRAKMR